MRGRCSPSRSTGSRGALAATRSQGSAERRSPSGLAPPEGGSAWRSDGCPPVRLSALTVAHEPGHLFGAWRHPEWYGNLAEPRERYTPHGFGCCNPSKGFKTIMSTVFLPDGSSCFFGPGSPDSFSNPDAYFDVAPTGTAELHDVARPIDESAPRMADLLERPTLHGWHLPLLPRAKGAARLHPLAQPDH